MPCLLQMRPQSQEKERQLPKKAPQALQLVLDNVDKEHKKVVGTGQGQNSGSCWKSSY